MKNNFILLSNSTGGIRTFEEILIKYILKNNYTCKIITNNYKNIIKKNINFKLYKNNNLTNIFKTISILKKIKNNKDRFIFIFSNQIIFIIYFFYIKIFFNKKKIYLFIHSHITKKNIFLLFSIFLSTFFSIFINKIFYVSNFTKKWWERRFFLTLFTNNQIKYNSVDLQKKNLKNKKKFCIGFVGRTDKEKGLQKFLKIANIYRNKYKFYVFHNDKNNIKKNKENVEYFYNLNKKDIYKKINLLLITSPIENCPYTVLEAKSFGIPTIAFLTRGGIEEIIKNYYDGFIITKSKSILVLDKYFSKIEKNYKKFSKNAFNSSKKYNANKEIPKLLKQLL
tara:strand:+ start:229 stop:1242 length:1014 start_codon:yes stop_codon:yes gene_type:complete